MIRLRGNRAFTLVELMIAIAVVGVISVVIYRLFDVTSQNFREVDQLSEINDRIRFANEKLRVYLQAAGSQATPDSDLDPDVRPALGGNARVLGILPYPGWQDDQPAAMRDANPNASYDGIIVLGAYDFGVSFEMSGLIPAGSNREGWIVNDIRGLDKLAQQDPFQSELTDVSNATWLMASYFTRANMDTRLIRLLDRQGNKQFVKPESFGSEGSEYVSVELPADESLFGPKFKGGTNGLAGLDDLPEGDTAYDAAFLDAFWIHVEPSPSNPNVMELVRERLCASIVVEQGATAAFTPEAALPANCGGTRDRTVLATHVADFQIWFDCAADVGPSGGEPDGGVRNLQWGYGWSRLDHQDPDCMNTATMEPGKARAAHIRLSLHTHQERPDQRHTQFEDLEGAVCPPVNGDEPGPCDADRLEFATLRTFDFMPDTAGSARVVVMQTDFELVNFVNRNQL